ncbi:hypothetical protein [Arthrobacter sp. NPDC093139]|uniref:hypothetical protein n=1 Tax=Arthrobacter sp. NPDC093139 TaxID=3363945 RepID=UPI003819117B
MTTSIKLMPEQLNRPTQYGYQRSVVANWCELIPGDTVLLLGPLAGERHRGTIDAISADGTVMWLLLENAGGRKLFHHVDGYQTLVDPVRTGRGDQ